MRVSLVAERYAKALFDLAVEKQRVEKVYEDVTELLSVCRENRMFVLMLRNPVISEEKKKNILEDLFGKNFQEVTMRFLLILVRKGREMYIPEIAAAMIELYKTYRHILTIHLTTAVPVSEAILNRVREVMKGHTDWQVDLVQEIDPGIIGGFILNWDDMQYDASIRYQIERFRRSSARINLYKKGF